MCHTPELKINTRLHATVWTMGFVLSKLLAIPIKAFPVLNLKPCANSRSGEAYLENDIIGCAPQTEFTIKASCDFDEFAVRFEISVCKSGHPTCCAY